MADPFADIPIKGDKLDPFADIPQKKPVDESKPAITFPSPLPKREKGFASGLVSGMTPFGLGEEGPSTMSQTPAAKEYRKGEEVAEPLGIGLDVASTAFPAYKAGQAVYKGGKTLAERLALGKTSKTLAEDLRATGEKRAGQIAKKTGEEMTAAEQRAAIAGTAEEKATRGSEMALKPLPGVGTELEAGRFKPVAQTAQDIGTKIKDSANRVMESLKAKRDLNAKTNKQAAFGEAFKKESAGQNITQTKAYGNALQEIDAMIKNPTTGLSSAPVGEIENQLKKIRGMLDRKIVDVDGTVISRAPASFEGLEDARRFLRDRSFGMPAEGYDAIGQQMAGRLADRIEAIMVEFSPETKTFLTQYKKDSEPLRVFQSKVGKALTGEQLPGGGANFAQVSAQDIPGRVFSSRENFGALVDAFGGNRQLAEAEAKRFFASQMEGKGTAKEVENFIRQNRAMLKETNSLPMAEKYAIDLRKYEQRAGAAGKVAKSEAQIAKEKKQLVQDYQTFESDLAVAANDPAKITSVSNQLAKRMLDHGQINQMQYRELQAQIEKVRLTARDAEQMKGQIKLFVYRALGYGALATAGSYGAVKAFE